MVKKPGIPDKIDMDKIFDGMKDDQDDSAEIEVLDPTTGEPVQALTRSDEKLEIGEDDEGESPRYVPPNSHEEARAEVEKYRDLWIHVQADFENFRKRVERDRHEERTQAGAALAKDLLGVLDNLERGIEGVGSAVDSEDAFVQGVVLIHKQFLETLVRSGLEPIDALGKAFDPVFHNAVATEKTATIEPNHVLAEIQKGYMFRGRILRPSLVKVSTQDSDERRVQDASPGDPI